MADFSSAIWNKPAAAAAPADDVVTKSCRFENASTSNLYQDNPATDSARKMTLSFWVKLVEVANGGLMAFGASAAGGGSQSQFDIRQETDGTIGVRSQVNNSYNYEAFTTRLFRDFSSFYHIVIAVDTDQPVAADRLKFYVNNEQETLTGSFPALNYDDRFGETGTNVKNRISTGVDGTSAWLPSSSYMADVIRIDGQQLTPSSFAIEDSTTGQWKPKDTSGLTFGSAGFRLDFEDSSAIGNDVSGEGNDFDGVSGLAASDIVNDRPTSNFCTWNPISGPPRPATTFSEGNLKVVGNYSTHFPRVMGTMLVSSGKWFHEIRCGSTNTNSREYGFKGHQTSWPVSGGSHGLAGGSAEWDTNAEFAFSAYHGGIKFSNSSTPETSGTTWGTAGDIIGLALDLDSSTRTLRVFKNGSEVGTATDIPAGGSDDWVPALDPTSGLAQTSVANFGQDATFAGTESGTTYTTDASDDDTGGEFTMQPPAGYKAWTTKNLTATIAKPSEHFDTDLWSGTSAATRDIATPFDPAFVWIKCRSHSGNGADHTLWDSVRGVNSSVNTALASSADEPEGFAYNISTTSQYGGVSALGTNLYTLKAGASTDGGGAEYRYVNETGRTYVGWSWKAGTSFEAEAGESTSGSKNVDAGFSIATWTGDDEDMMGESQTITHGLNPLTPEMIIAKGRTDNNATGSNWLVYHKDLSSGEYLILNSTGSPVSPMSAVIDNIGDTTVDFGSDNSSYYLNYGGDEYMPTDPDTYVAYFFASVEGYSKCGSYEGNNSTDGPLVYCGFKPRWICVKRIDGIGSWIIVDTARDPYNDTDATLAADTSSAESSYAATSDFDILSNGFKLRHSTATGYANQADTYIFYAVAESPFKYANAR